ncbi:MAG: Fur family transcriptional regulator [Cyanobacteria bacterium]|nr:Fur family transcriptional regulator [Cyanobacteriota bacterium]MDA0864997.1 Fur family transcriptional regulator [Cyanobacteriota bacterium]
MLSTHCTPAQTAVLQTLQRQHRPLSAQSLYTLMCQHQRIGLATVYRSLDALKRLGRVQHRATLEGEMLYSAVEADHHYMTCLHCGQSFPLDRCPLKAIEAQLQGSSSFTIYYHTLEFFGLCEPCAIQMDGISQSLSL